MNQLIPPLQNGAQTVFFQVATEWCFLRTPSDYVTAGPSIPCVIFCHGNSGYVRDGDYRVSAKDTLDDEGKSIFIRTLIDAGIAVAGIQARELDDHCVVRHGEARRAARRVRLAQHVQKHAEPP